VPGTLARRWRSGGFAGGFRGRLRRSPAGHGRGRPVIRPVQVRCHRPARDFERLGGVCADLVWHARDAVASAPRDGAGARPRYGVAGRSSRGRIVAARLPRRSEGEEHGRPASGTCWPERTPRRRSGDTSGIVIESRLARAEAAAGGVCGRFASGPLLTREAALFTDLYELTMAASYFRERMHGEATFSLFLEGSAGRFCGGTARRRAPPPRSSRRLPPQPREIRDAGRGIPGAPRSGGFGAAIPSRRLRRRRRRR
jgi:hypothetical protein